MFLCSRPLAAGFIALLLSCFPMLPLLSYLSVPTLLSRPRSLIPSLSHFLLSTLLSCPSIFALLSYLLVSTLLSLLMSALLSAPMLALSSFLMLALLSYFVIGPTPTRLISSVLRIFK